ncbi:MAG TPA: hypothetical protein VE621_18205, partial [Bryobacteraceae bacterium]|nr:hypothetical protein [Bryobacteraceae bacterium]
RHLWPDNRERSPVAAFRGEFAMKRHALLLITFLSSLLSVQGQQATYGGQNITGRMQLVRTVNVSALGQFGSRKAEATFASFDVATPEFKPPKQLLRAPQQSSFGAKSESSLREASSIETAASSSLDIQFPAIAGGFLGLTHLDQRLANNGNQYSVEPPNTSIAVANGFVLEGVNNAIQIYSVAGVPQLPKVLSSNELFGVPPAIDRSTGINGPFPTDMRVFHDQTINRWIVLQRAQDYDIFGFPMNSSRLYMAVSQSSDPMGGYGIYEMDTTDLSHPGCPCLSDFPQIGADQYGFYISVNQYTTISERFVNAAILALSKIDLAAGVPLPKLYEFKLPFTTGFEFALQPAVTPPGASYFLANGGLEYFVSTQARSAVNNSVALWAMYNTSSLNTANPSLTLVQTTLPTLAYFLPDVATQKPGPIPYGSSLGQSLSFIDGADCRVLALSYAGGRLFATFGSQVTDSGGRSLVGGVYLILAPSFRAGALNALIVRQGYLSVERNHLLRPAIAVNPQGNGAISVTLVGPDHFPSAALVPISISSSSATLQLVAAGAAPQDGFTGYNGFPARWGDYSAAFAAADGSVWLGMQFIPAAPRTEAANWGTYITRYAP